MTKFDEFWKVYPNKVNKKKARELWDAANLDEKAETIIYHTEIRAKKDEKWLKGYIIGPDVFIRNERWNDEYQESKPKFTRYVGPEPASDPTVPSEGLLGAARAANVSSEGLTSVQIEKLIWAKRHGGIHLEQLPKSQHHLLTGPKPPF